jgi:UDP-glucuronate 4-epimerase
MNILITGAAGFIGYNLSNILLEKKHKIYAIDNFDNYYSINIKKKRISLLKKNRNFLFHKVDITNKKSLENFFKKKKIDLVIHLAAQAGVRYSLVNPQKYIDVNIFGFLNLIEQIRLNKIKNFFYASSSSVYGDSTKFPLDEKQPLNPKNIYGLSKKLNEQIAELYSKCFKINSTGLRFFTIYGEWGRPDMFMLKLFKAKMNKKIFELNNYGNHKRDFTYIDDATHAICGLIKKKQKGHNIYNICSNNPIKISKIINYFKNNNNVNVKLVKMHKADVKDTHGKNTKIKKTIKNFKISNFYKCFDRTYKWYIKNNIQNIR